MVFFSNFLALMAKADVSDEKAQSQEMFGLILIAVHASMVIAIVAQVYLSMQAATESRDDLVGVLAKKGAHSGSGGGGGGDGNRGDGDPDVDGGDAGGRRNDEFSAHASNDSGGGGGGGWDREEGKAPRTVNLNREGDAGHYPHRDASGWEDVEG